VLGPGAGRSRERPFRHDSSPGRLERRDRARTWIGNENAGWRRFRGEEEGLPKNEKGVGELANCYGASPGALRRDSTTLGGLAKGAGELGRGG